MYRYEYLPDRFEILREYIQVYAHSRNAKKKINNFLKMYNHLNRLLADCGPVFLKSTKSYRTSLSLDCPQL